MRGAFKGSLVALPTPLRDGRVDFAALRRLIEFQLAGGTDGLVIAGSTGEAVTLTTRERSSVIEFSAGVVDGRVPVIAGVGSSDTRVTCELAQAAERAGADGVLVSTPAYNKPQQRGLVAHFSALARSTALPVVLYNIPGRTGVDLLPATVREIARGHRNVIAIKEAGTSLERVKELVADAAVDVLLGEDSWIVDGLQLGALGVVGVMANVVPRPVSELVHELLAGETGRAPARVERLAPLVSALFLETNPAPLKAALEMLGLCSGELRLPLVPIEPATRARLRQALVVAGALAPGAG
ncbi:MAG: 4-hydroxy-tetrahydrodipicolinate synthase [Planctomycetes bacterium]|nr:4-hydroxy-tetrahydrodipicolinate synthase [Planctomycetota bacterium]